MKYLLLVIFLCSCGMDMNTSLYNLEDQNEKSQFNRINSCSYTEWYTNNDNGLFPVITNNDDVDSSVEGIQLDLAVRFLGGYTNNVYIKLNDVHYKTSPCYYDEVVFNCARVSIYNVDLVMLSTVVSGTCPEQLSAASVVK